MKFQEAFQQMKQGKKVKLPSWGGYWIWDEEKKTIMMHCKDGTVLDIRETEDVEYTLGNACSDEWIIADEENTPILGGVATFSFSEAIKYIKRGLKVARKGWNGKNMWIYLSSGSKVFYTDLKEETKQGLRGNRCVDNNGFATINSHIDMSAADGSVVIGWSPSQTDILSEDWYIVD